MDGIEIALAQGALSRAIRLGLLTPGETMARALFSEDGVRALLRAAELLEAGAAVGLREAVAGLCPAEAPPGVLRTSHERLFGHALRGRVCPYGTEHGTGGAFQQAQELANISGFYLAFGLRPSVEEAERPDHVACELEFLEILSLKEAYALERKDETMLQVTREAMRLFLKEHLGRFGVAFGASLAREEPDGFYGSLGRLCAAFLRSACSRLGAPAGPELLPLRSDEDDGAPMACGRPEELVQIGPSRQG